MRTQEFMENLASFKESQNAEQIEKLEAARYPVDVAMVLADSDEEELRAFLSFFEAKDIASVIEEASPALQKRIVALLGADKTIRAFSFMSSDDITDILGFLSISQRRAASAHEAQRFGRSSNSTGF
jgi:Mg/Co/Ni transporter MgtE